jgi:hypothetical protein
VTPTHTRVVSDAGEFAALGDRWDELVRRAPVPCAFLLHAWLMQPIRFYGTTRELTAPTAPASRASSLLHSLADASGEGVRRVELLGGEHAYKMPFASGSQPLLQGVGLATSPSGHAAVASLRAGVAARVALKRHEPLRRVDDEGRRMLRHLTV